MVLSSSIHRTVESIPLLVMRNPPSPFSCRDSCLLILFNNASFFPRIRRPSAAGSIPFSPLRFSACCPPFSDLVSPFLKYCALFLTASLIAGFFCGFSRFCVVFQPLVPFSFEVTVRWASKAFLLLVFPQEPQFLHIYKQSFPPLSLLLFHTFFLKELLRGSFAAAQNLPTPILGMRRL